jgi:hypothetical protein
VDLDHGETGWEEREDADPCMGEYAEEDPGINMPNSDRKFESAFGPDSDVADESDPGKRLVYPVEGEVMGVDRALVV